MSRYWLYIAFGISGALIVLGAFSIMVTQSELASGQRTITIVGDAVCLPHKKPWIGLFGGRADTQECYWGLRGEDGKHYGIICGKIINKNIRPPFFRFSYRNTYEIELFPFRFQ